MVSMKNKLECVATNRGGSSGINGNKSAARQIRPTQAIIENNRKTELCRNWGKGTCTYGTRCAFAHGEKELKHRTPREMEMAGRIPDASKYRCYPCWTWVSTGSCPYDARCVFIHDPRVEGTVEAQKEVGCKSPSAYPSSDSSFFFPDMSRDPDSPELPTHPSLYDLDPRMGFSDDVSSRAVYNLWYSFVSINNDGSKGNNTANSPMSTRSGGNSNINTDIGYRRATGVNTAASVYGSPRSRIQNRCSRWIHKYTTNRPTVDPRHPHGHTSHLPVLADLPVFVDLSRGVHPRPMTPPFPMLQHNRTPPINGGNQDYWSAWDDLLILETSSVSDDAVDDYGGFCKTSPQCSAAATVDIDDDRSSSLSGYISSSSIHSWDSVLSDESHMVLRHHNHAVYPAAETEPEGLGSRDAGGCAFVESFNRNFNGNDKAVHVNGTHCGYGNVVGGVCGASSNWGQKQDRWLYVKSALIDLQEEKVMKPVLVSVFGSAGSSI